MRKITEFLCFFRKWCNNEVFFAKNPEKIAKNLKNIQKIFELYRVICYNIEIS